ncbi:hypothetical protein LJE72_08690 [Desulfosporosinus sp. SRJS8]|nr:hypothetical protein [Desulfosporosinus sp. SRJS8]
MKNQCKKGHLAGLNMGLVLSVRDETIRWVEPTLLLKKRFLEWTDEGKLRYAQITDYFA